MLLQQWGSSLHNTSWIWHPDWNDTVSNKTDGGVVDFRRRFDLETVPQYPVKIAISADTRYRLHISPRFIHARPAKGDSQEWYYDELDIQPYLQTGSNFVAIRVLRLLHGSHHGISFVRMPLPGLYIAVQTTGNKQKVTTGTDEEWETSIDDVARFPCDLKEDDFLHVYEEVNRASLAE